MLQPMGAVTVTITQIYFAVQDLADPLLQLLSTPEDFPGIPALIKKCPWNYSMYLCQQGFVHLCEAMKYYQNLIY